MTAPIDTPDSQRRLLGWIWRGYMRRRRAALFTAMGLMTIEGSMIALLSYLIKPMFDEVFVGGKTGAVIWVSLGVAGVFLLRALAGFGHRVIMARLGEGFVADLQADMLGHLMTLDQGFYQAHPPGNLIERTRGDSATLKTLWTQIIAAAGRDLVALIALLAVAFSVDWVWTLVAICGVPLVLLPAIALQRLVRKTSRRARAAAAVISTRLDEIFHGIVTIQLTGSEAREQSRFRATLDTYLKSQMRAETGAAGIPALMDIVAAIGFAAVLGYGGYQIIGGTKTVGEFMSFFTAMALLFDPLRRLGAVSGAWQVARASLERLRAVFDMPATITSPASPAPLPAAADGPRVALEDVTFAYDRDPVLHGTSLIAEAGKTTALVGPSGAGKSTVFALLARLADPQSGRVTVNGADVRSLDLATLRQQFSVVSQDAALFDETLRDNILMGAANIPEERLRAAIVAANAAEFIDALPLGLDTPAGPRGSALSGGQRQRIAIARALLRDAPILLLDEATSALDARSEKLVQEALERLSLGRTTLVIAHRLSTVRNADKIVVMDKGRVTETGTHDELIAAGGTYAALYRLQFTA